jgi:hypothetical protein
MKQSQLDACVQRVRAKNPGLPAYLFEGEYLAEMERGIERGAAQERARVQGIDMLQVAGLVPPECRATVQMMKYDGKSTADDVALVIAPPIKYQDPAAAADAAAMLWDRLPAIRTEFTSKESYVALKVAEAKGLISQQRSTGLFRQTFKELGK